MTPPTAGRGGGPRPELLVLAALFLLLGTFRLNDLFLYTPDGARYLVWGASIARGDGWLDDTQTEPLRYVVHAPLYPALLAPVEALFPMRTIPAKAWTLLWGALALILLHRWIERDHGRAAAFAGAAIFALNPGFLVYSTEILSEAPFLALFLAILLIATRAAAGEGLSRGERIVLVASSAALGLLREVGVVVTACVVIALWKPDRRTALAIIAAAVVAVGAWHLRNDVLVGAPPGAPGSNLALALAQAAGGDGALALTDAASQTWSNLLSYLGFAAGRAFHPLYGPQRVQLLESPVAIPAFLEWAAAALFGGLIAVGAVRAVRSGRAGLLAVASGAALLLAAAVYPVRDARFVAPLLPLTIAWIAGALASPGGGENRPGRSRVLLAIVAIVAILPNVPAVGGVLSLNGRYRADAAALDSALAARNEAPEYYRKPWSLLGAWIEAHLSADAVIATPAKEIAVVAGGRKVLELDPGVPQALFERLLRANGVTHLLAPMRWGSVRVYEPFTERTRRMVLTDVHDAAGLRLYRIDWKAFDDPRNEAAEIPPLEPTRDRGGAAADLLRAGRARLLDGALAEAAGLFDSAAALVPDRPDPRFEQVVAASMAGDTAAAALAFDALAQFPQAASFLVGARRHRALGGELAAIARLDTAGERTMRALDASRAYWEMGYYEFARDLLRPAAEADPEFFVGHLWNFHFNFQLRDEAAALRSLAVLDRIDSANSLVRNFHRLVELRRAADASSGPARGALRLRMAEIDRDIELFDEAFDLGEGALRDDPSSPAAARFLAALHASLGAPRRAVAMYRESLRLDPSDAAALAAADSITSALSR